METGMFIYLDLGPVDSLSQCFNEWLQRELSLTTRFNQKTRLLFFETDYLADFNCLNEETNHVLRDFSGSEPRASCQSHRRVGPTKQTRERGCLLS